MCYVWWVWGIVVTIIFIWNGKVQRHKQGRQNQVSMHQDKLTVNGFLHTCTHAVAYTTHKELL